MVTYWDFVNSMVLVLGPLACLCLKCWALDRLLDAGHVGPLMV